MPENEDAELVYNAVQEQYIMGADGLPIALNNVAIHEAIRMYKVKYRIDCFERVVTAGRYFINRIREKAAEQKK